MNQSFIEEARRRQLVEAAIEVLNVEGYAHTSLSKIAKQAGVSTSLTLYHFKHKQELMMEVLSSIYSGLVEEVRRSLHRASDPRQELRAYISASLDYMGARPRYFGAMIELMFNTRDLNAGLSYREAKTDELLDILMDVLERGQKSGDFKTFDIALMTVMIRGSIDQFLGYSVLKPMNIEAYQKHITEGFEQMILKDGRHD